MKHGVYILKANRKVKNTHKLSLPEAIMDVVKPIFKDLSDAKSLKHYLHEKAQNSNGNGNGLMWQNHFCRPSGIGTWSNRCSPVSMMVAQQK